MPYHKFSLSLPWFGGLFAMGGNAYSLQSLVMCSNTFNVTKIEVTEGYANFSSITR